jgi:hypothetical protein
MKEKLKEEGIIYLLDQILKDNHPMIFIALKEIMKL